MATSNIGSLLVCDPAKMKGKAFMADAIVGIVTERGERRAARSRRGGALNAPRHRGSLTAHAIVLCAPPTLAHAIVLCAPPHPPQAADLDLA